MKEKREDLGEGTWGNAMEKVDFFDEETSEFVEFYVLEQTRINNRNYLLVTIDGDGDSDALILKDTSGPEEEQASYQIVEEEAELNAVAKIFEELLGDEADLVL